MRRKEVNRAYYAGIHLLVRLRNANGTCIETGKLECPFITADESCFRCMDPYEADKLYTKSLQKQD